MQETKMAEPFLKQINKILDEVDPAGIIALVRHAGVDLVDEYEPEAEEILAAIKGCDSPEKLAEIINEIFDQYFYYPGVDIRIYKLSAYKIWNAWLIYSGKKPVSIPSNLLKIPRSDCKPTIIVA